MNKCIQCATSIHEELSIFNFYKPPQQFCETCKTMASHCLISMMKKDVQDALIIKYR